MPGFDPTILRDEEKVGGFDPGQSGNETFLLETLPSYPGEQPATVPAPEDARPEIADVPEVARTPEPVDAPDVVDVPEPVDAPDVIEVPETEATSEPVAEAETERQIPAPETSAPTGNEAMGIDDEREHRPGDERAEMPADRQTPEPETDTPRVYQDPLVLDDSLIALLKADLEDSKRKKKQQPDETDAADAYIASPPVEAMPSGDAPPGTKVEIDLGDIDAEHPSTYGIDRTAPPPAAPPAPDQQEEQPRLEKRRRRLIPLPLPLSRVAIAAGAVLALLLAAAAGYYFLMPGGEHAATTVSDSSAVQPDHTSAVHREAGASRAETEHGETAHSDTAAHGIAMADRADSLHTAADATAGHEALSHGQPVEGSRSKGAAEQTTPHGTTQAPHGTEQSRHGNDQTQHGKATNSGSGTSSPAVAAREAVPHERSAAREVPVKRTETNPESRPYKPQSPPPASARGEFVIQVYASPSADDADEWLQQLRKRNINDGFVTSQSVRGQTWYRVRFGKFSTREEAESRASQLGLSNVWVVRVR